MNYDTWLNTAILIANQRIDDQASIAQEYFANYGSVDEYREDYDYVCSVLKRKGYSKYGELFTKGFHCFKVVKQSNSKAVEKVRYWLDQPNTSVMEIKESFVTGVVVASNYFERI